MVTEFRKLVFSSGELRRAIEIFSNRKISVLPDGEVFEVVLEDGEEIRGVLRYDAADGSGRSERHRQGDAKGEPKDELDE